jgi:hypothetical protein
MRINGKFAPGYGTQTTHGLSHTRIYSIWSDMKKRCNNPKHKFWQYYGGRGIAVCERWNSFESFFADMGHPPSGTSLDRIDGRFGYKKENCRWATATQQSRNRSNSRLVRALGREMCITAWAEFLGVKESTIRARLNKGWSEHDAVSVKIKKVIPFEEWKKVKSDAQNVAETVGSDQGAAQG